MKHQKKRTKDKMIPQRCVLLGAGGHAGVLLDCLLQSGIEVVGLLERNSQMWNKLVLGVPVLGSDDLLARIPMLTHFVVGVGSAGNNGPRSDVYHYGLGHGLPVLSVVHRSAYLSPTAVVGQGLQLLAGALVNTGAILGDNVLINTGAVVEHDCRICNHVHIATGAKLAGNVWVGDYAHVGVGAVIRQGIRIGERAIVGAGAVVVKDVAPNSTVVGVPAKPLLRATRQAG
jgi:UDP-perosamine 4-acetyltransferase